MRDSAELARRLIADSCEKQNIQPGQLTVHAGGRSGSLDQRDGTGRHANRETNRKERNKTADS